MSTEFTWPKPYLLQLYERAVEEGCIRIRLRGETEPERAAEWKSFKAAFYRLRRKRDANFAVQMRPEFQMVGIKYEPELGKVLITFSSLPDGNTLPEIESIEGKTDIPQPIGTVPKPTPEEDPDEFDSTALVGAMISKIELEDGDGEL